MCKRTLFVMVVITLSFGLPAAYGLGDGNNEALKQSPTPKVAALKIESPKVELPQAVAPKARPKYKEMTKEELFVELKEELADNEEVLDMIPELKAEKGADGKVFYTFKGVKLEDLPKEDLNGLLTKARQATVRVRTERIQRQLEMAAQAQRVQRIAAPPQPPRIPSVPPSAPRIPSVPPSPPKK